VSLTLEDIRNRLKKQSEIDLLEVLHITSEDIVDRFEDRIEDLADDLEEDLDDIEEDEYEEE